LGEKIDFLRHMIGNGGLSPTNKDVSALENYKRPNNKKKMLRILRLSSFTPKYVPKFAELKSVLRNIMVSNKNHLVWSNKENDSFEKLKT
jgi:hypothetical protein